MGRSSRTQGCSDLPMWRALRSCCPSAPARRWPKPRHPPPPAPTQTSYSDAQLQAFAAPVWKSIRSAARRRARTTRSARRRLCKSALFCSVTRSTPPLITRSPRKRRPTRAGRANRFAPGAAAAIRRRAQHDAAARLTAAQSHSHGRSDRFPARACGAGRKASPTAFFPRAGAGRALAWRLAEGTARGGHFHLLFAARP